MRKRYVVLGLSAVLALAVAVPAIGQSSDPTATASVSLSGVNKKAKKALKKAKAANKKANQALNENDAQDTSITNIEQQLAGGGGGGGGVGPQGPPGPQGPAGPAGPAGTAAGATFTRTLDGTSSNVTAGGFTLTFSADNSGNCADPVLHDRNDSYFWASDQIAQDTDDNLDVDRTLNLIDNGETAVVTARTNSGTARAQWEFGLTSNADGSGDCFVAGTVFGT